MGKQVAARLKWGCSSVGRAPALQAGGQEFESLHLHSVRNIKLCNWPMYIENFIQKVLRKNICDILIKTSENREYRKIWSVQITKRKHSYSITEKLFKKADPVSNAIETVTGQAKKSAGWMPWHWEPMKDVISCEKLRGDANNLWSADVWMGKPVWAYLIHPYANP